MGMHYKGENGVSMNVHYITKKMRREASDGVYRLTDAEVKEIKERNRQNKIEREKEKADKKSVRMTTYELLSKALNTRIDAEAIKRCDRFRNLGNGRYAIKCVDSDKMIILMKSQKGVTYKYRVIQ